MNAICVVHLNSIFCMTKNGKIIIKKIRTSAISRRIVHYGIGSIGNLTGGGGPELPRNSLAIFLLFGNIRVVDLHSLPKLK